MKIVAFDLGRAAHVAFDQDGAGVSAERERGRVILGAAGDDVFGLANVRNDGFFRELDASRHAGEAERSAHDLEESAARDRVEPFGGVLRELAVQGFLEFGRAGKLFKRSPVLRSGFFADIVGIGGVDFFADEVQIELLARTDVARAVVFIVRHSARIRISYSSAPSRLLRPQLCLPTASAGGCILSPLRGWRHLIYGTCCSWLCRVRCALGTSLLMPLLERLDPCSFCRRRLPGSLRSAGGSAC